MPRISSNEGLFDTSRWPASTAKPEAGELRRDLVAPELHRSLPREEALSVPSALHARREAQGRVIAHEEVEHEAWDPELTDAEWKDLEDAEPSMAGDPLSYEARVAAREPVNVDATAHVDRDALARLDADAATLPPASLAANNRARAELGVRTVACEQGAEFGTCSPTACADAGGCLTDPRLVTARRVVRRATKSSRPTPRTTADDVAAEVARRMGWSSP